MPPLERNRGGSAERRGLRLCGLILEEATALVYLAIDARDWL